MNSRDFIRRISNSFRELFRSDAELFDLGTEGINEQTLTFRLGLYLADEFRDHNVDCEYNRLWDGKKSCVRLGINWMKPDVIIHIRQSDKANLFCLEAKKLNLWENIEAIPDDVEKKLKALTLPDEAYRYSVGLAWRIHPSADPRNHEAVWFVGGVKVLVTQLSNFESTLDAKLTQLKVFA